MVVILHRRVAPAATSNIMTRSEFQQLQVRASSSGTTLKEFLRVCTFEGDLSACNLKRCEVDVVTVERFSLHLICAASYFLVFCCGRL